MSAHAMVFLFGLCWGSFLNVIAHRLMHNKKVFTPRSHCPSCDHTIVWYDNIPLISWLFLRGQCRFCKAPISWLYPFTELVTAILVTALFHKIFIPPLNVAAAVDFTLASTVWSQVNRSFVVYFIFISALVAATRTDLEALLIPQLFTLWMIPIAIGASFLHITNVTPLYSVLGAVIGYAVLWAIALIFQRTTGKEGMGIGDMELLAMIGAFIGPLGTWVSLMVGSLVGLLVGALYLVFSRQGRNTRIPFGPFLSLGAVIYFFCGPVLLRFLWG